MAWNKYVLKKNISNSNTKLILLSFLPAIAGSIYGFIYYLNANSASPEKYIVGILFSIIVFLILTVFTIAYYFALRKIIFYKSKKLAINTAGFLENTKTVFNEDEIFSENLTTKTTSKYRRFIGFYENANYLFLRLTKIQAVILPKKYFTSEQIDFIKSKVSNSLLKKLFLIFRFSIVYD